MSSEGAVQYFEGVYAAYSALDITAPPNSADGSGDVYLIPTFGESVLEIADVPYSSSAVLFDTTVYSSPSEVDFVGLGISPSCRL